MSWFRAPTDAEVRLETLRLVVRNVADGTDWDVILEVAAQAVAMVSSLKDANPTPQSGEQGDAA